MLPGGPGDANQVAVNPCFVRDELPADASKPCEQIKQPAFDGSFVYYSSGFLPDGEVFEVKLAPDTPPGPYAFYCNLHGPMMSGVINVVAPGTDIPDQSEVEAQAKREMDETFAPIKAAYGDAAAGKTPFGNLAGFGSEEAENAGIMEFLPGRIEAKVGQRVEWTIFGPRTITFNPTKETGYILVQAPDKTWHLSEKAMAPAGGPGMPAPEGPPGEGAAPPPDGAASDGPPTPQLVDAGRFGGKGLLSSGLFLSFPGPGSFFSYGVTFDQPGTYGYVCLVHPKMTGTVVVTA